MFINSMHSFKFPTDAANINGVQPSYKQTSMAISVQRKVFNKIT